MAHLRSTTILAFCIPALLALLVVGGCQTDRGQESARSFVADEPLLPVRENDRWGFIDPAGNLVVAPRFDHAWRFSGGLALVQEGQAFGYVRPDGNYAIEPQFDDAWHFLNGRAPVEVNGRWTYIDSSGSVIADSQSTLPPEVVVEARYDDDAFELIRANGRYGFRSEDGEQVIDPRFEQAWRFSEDLARAKLDGKWGYIGRDGNFVIEPAYDQAWDFQNGIAMVEFGDTIGYIDRDGRRIWPREGEMGDGR